MDPYWPGSSVYVPCVVRVNGALTDPSTLKIEYQNPQTGTVTTKIYGTDAAVVRDSLGTFHITLVPDVHGTWTYRWTSTGLGAQVFEGEFHVQKAKVRT